MKLIEFPEQTNQIAEHQDEYNTMPAHVDPTGTVTCCWELTEEEKIILMETGKIWHRILTYQQPVQPQHLSVESPFI